MNNGRKNDPWDESSGCWLGMAGLLGTIYLVVICVIGFGCWAVYELIQWITSK